MFLHGSDAQKLSHRMTRKNPPFRILMSKHLSPAGCGIPGIPPVVDKYFHVQPLRKTDSGADRISGFLLKQNNDMPLYARPVPGSIFLSNIISALCSGTQVNILRIHAYVKIY